MARPCRAVLALVTLGLLPAPPAHAQWSPDSNVNNAAFVGPGSQTPVLTVSDGAGGAIFVWRNVRDLGGGSFAFDLLAQRIDAVGVTQWPAAGVTLVTNTVSAQATLLLPPFAAVADGNGGAIAAWRDVRNDAGDIFAARVDATGVVPWTPGGVAIATVAGLQQRPVLAVDGSGGAIVTWQDRRSGDADVYAQRVTSAGAIGWATANGVPVCMTTGDQLLPGIVSDGAGGAIIAWSDARGGDVDVYAQRMLAAGTALWTPATGVPLSTVAGQQNRPVLASDGASGAIVVWEDARNGADNDVYARRVTSAGAAQWTADGVQVAGTANASFPVVVGDGAGNTIVAWTDERNGGGNTDVFAQRLDGSGAVQWVANGVSVAGAAGGQFFPAAVADGSGGIVVGWEDGRNGAANVDVFAQRLDAAGAALWATDGRPVSTAAGGQAGVSVAADGAGGAVLGWADGRAVVNPVDVYAAHVDGSGALPVTLERFVIE